MSRGFGLLETLVCTAVLGIALSACFFTFSALARFSAHQAGPVHEAAALLAEQTLRDAEQAWKYGSPGNAPQGVTPAQLHVVEPGSSPSAVPATVSVTTSNTGADGASIDVVVTYTPDPNRQDGGSIELQGQTLSRAPLPGSQVVRPGFVPAPTASPCC